MFSVVGFIVGIYFSYMHSTPTGASIVIADVIMFILFNLVEKIKAR